MGHLVARVPGGSGETRVGEWAWEDPPTTFAVVSTARREYGEAVAGLAIVLGVGAALGVGCVLLGGDVDVMVMAPLERMLSMVRLAPADSHAAADCRHVQ